MIVIMGASGRVGGAALSALARSGRKIRAISRQPRAQGASGVEWVVADALDSDALASAFEGAEAVFVLNSAPIDAGDVFAEAARLSTSIAKALAKAAPPHAIVLSSQGGHLREGTGVVATLYQFEQALKQATRTQLTILRPAYFMETWAPLAQAALATAHLPGFLDPSSRAIDTVSAQDVGETAARYLLNPAPGIVNIVGPQPYSDDDAAKILTDLTGKCISVDPVPAMHVAAAHEAVGLGASYAAAIAGLYAAINGGTIPYEDVGETITGRTTLRDVLAASIA